MSLLTLKGNSTYYYFWLIFWEHSCQNNFPTHIGKMKIKLVKQPEEKEFADLSFIDSYIPWQFLKFHNQLSIWHYQA